MLRATIFRKIWHSEVLAAVGLAHGRNSLKGRKKTHFLLQGGVLQQHRRSGQAHGHFPDFALGTLGSQGGGHVLRLIEEGLGQR